MAINPDIYGVSLDYVLTIRDVVDAKLLKAYRLQRKRAAERGIDWQLNLREWYEIWQRSGKLERRGCRDGDACVMGRKADAGPYAVGNVYICTVRQNMIDGQRNKPNMTRNGRGDPRGYYFMPYACPSKPYQVRTRGKFIGYFATAEEAKAADLKAQE